MMKDISADLILLSDPDVIALDTAERRAMADIATTLKGAVAALDYIVNYDSGHSPIMAGVAARFSIRRMQAAVTARLIREALDRLTLGDQS